MGIPGSANPMLFGGAAAYQINQSLRFDSGSSAYLNRTPASAGNRKTWTWSGWVKRSGIASDQALLQIGTASSDSTFFRFRLDSGNKIRIGGGLTSWRITTSVYRDTSAWYHVVLAIDTTQATANNRIRLYINGAEITAFDTTNNPSQNADLAINDTAAHNIGRDVSGADYLNGYLAEVNFIDGTALTPSSFGETDTITGAWVPKKYSGSYGTNGFYLNFSDNSGTTSTTLGKDSSGNGNNWTPNGFSVTAGAGNDVLSDTPTTNWCTLNPLANGGTLANGNLQFSTGASHALSKSTFALPSTGLWYAEATVSTLTSATVAAGFGLGTAALSNTAVASSAAGAWEIYASDARYFNRNGTQTNISGTFAANAVLQIAVDMANSRAWVGVDNTWYNGTNGTTGDPGAGTNPTFTSLPAELFVIANTYSNTLNINFGQRAFAYTPPTGFKALNTANLPEPTIKKGSAHFNTILWTGNNANPRTLSGVGFQPDWVWLKDRTQSTNHRLVDAVRGGNKTLKSNLTDSETSSEAAGTITAFTSDGFTVQGTSTVEGVNLSGDSYVAWNWKANGAGSSNTAGTITSTVSANASAGFSIVTYTGTGSNATVGHGLGVAPSMIIVKNRIDVSSWQVYHSALGPTKVIFLESTQAALTSSVRWNDTAPTSTVFTIGTDGGMNGSSDGHVAYCFSEVAGYSKFGSYTGNGSTDGPFVFCNFKPVFVLTKCSSNSGDDWRIWDKTRPGYNLTNLSLAPNTSAAEDTSPNNYAIDILSNGFKLRSLTTGTNGSGRTYIYAAFAELPFKYSNAR